MKFKELTEKSSKNFFDRVRRKILGNFRLRLKFW